MLFTAKIQDFNASNAKKIGAYFYIWGKCWYSNANWRQSVSFEQKLWTVSAKAAAECVLDHCVCIGDKRIPWNNEINTILYPIQDFIKMTELN